MAALHEEQQAAADGMRGKYQRLEEPNETGREADVDVKVA